VNTETLSNSHDHDEIIKARKSREEYLQIQKKFSENYSFEINFDPEIQIHFNLLPRINIINSKDKLKHKQSTKTQYGYYKLDANFVDLYNWNTILSALLEFRIERRLYNMVFSYEIIKEILRNNSFYSITCYEKDLYINSIEDFARLQNIALILLKKYLIAFYQKQKQNWVKKELK
jgi:hypothetical protein